MKTKKHIAYVALLRGINVGGNNIIKMEALRAEFEHVGFEQVSTYIQSGNVLFFSNIDDTDQIEKKLEKALSLRFNYKARVLVRSRKEMQAALKHFPRRFADKNWKHNVIFLSKAIDSKKILKQCVIKKEIEEVVYYKGVLFWSAKLSDLTRSTMLRLSSRPEYKEMTIRNTNTTKKIVALLEKMV